MPNFDIGLRYYAGIPDGYLDDLRAALPHDEFDVSEDEFQPGPFDAMEWVIPTAVAVYITKPFLDVILKRAADDFGNAVYPRLKSGIAGLAKKLFIWERIPLKRVTRDGATEAPESMVFSIYSETITKTRIKFVFAKTLSEDEYDVCVAQAFQMLEQHHRNGGSGDNLSQQIAKLPENRLHQIFLLYNAETRLWEVHDPIQESID